LDASSKLGGAPFERVIRAGLVLAFGIVMYLRAHQPDQVGIARAVILGLLAIDPVFELHLDLEAHLARRRHRHAHMVGLHRAGSQQRIGALLHRLADIKFQLPALVAAESKPGAIVTLYPHPGVEFGADVCHKLQRCRPMAQLHAGEIFGQ
jgi:hypothetical protein